MELWDTVLGWMLALVTVVVVRRMEQVEKKRIATSKLMDSFDFLLDNFFRYDGAKGSDHIRALDAYLDVIQRDTVLYDFFKALNRYHRSLEINGYRESDEMVTAHNELQVTREKLLNERVRIGVWRHFLCKLDR